MRGYTGLYYARTPALIWTSPMNNYRLPPGDVSVQLPYITPTGPQTLYEQFLLVGIDLNRYALDQLPVLSTEQLSQIASALGLSAQPVCRSADDRDGYGVPQSPGDTIRLRCGARAVDRPDGGRRVHLRGHRLPAAEPRDEPLSSRAATDRPGAAAVLPRCTPSGRAGLGAAPRVHGQLRIPRPGAHHTAAEGLGTCERQLRAVQVDVR